MAANLDTLVEELSKLSVLEAAELVKKLEEKWGVSAAAPVAVAAVAGAAPAAAAAEPVEEKTEFDVIIKDAGPKKIETIKVIRQLTSLGLGEAKALAETAGGKVLSAVGKDAAMDAKKKLEEAGAVVEVV
ncbi:MAG: 50S ribosomal protein L7/L12 [Anaerolineales bacterium]|nr:50S ribosomal protein L7/L12 [Anaerolineales bacterium]MCX7754718.1 50S ribosomal protein L7/L12 [Anaerolineales bacterium]MDW8279504.1 50S ribosomal protein L7/L12 [Anaerolineales bacterium]